MTPKRIQRKRTKGWRMPEGAVYVGRPTKWGNPFKESDGLELWETINHYRAWVCTSDLDLNELRGKDLVCWCALDEPCHADVLLKLANQERDE